MKSSLRKHAKLIAAVIGLLLGALCAELPAEYRKPCEVASHLLPATCSDTQELVE